MLGSGYLWLGIGESRNLTLAWSGLLALLLFLIACATHGAAFAFFGFGEGREVLRAWKTSARNLLPLGAAALAIAVVYWLLSVWQEYSSNPAFTLASFLTLTSRKPVEPKSVERVFDAALWLVRWAVLPVVLLPMLAAISLRGWGGFASAGRDLRRWWFWLAAPLLLLCALWVPFRVLGWKPRMGSFALEVVSFSLRAALAYLLFGAAWLALAFATWAGRPRLTQSSTAVSP